MKNCYELAQPQKIEVKEVEELEVKERWLASVEQEVPRSVPCTRLRPFREKPRGKPRSRAPMLSTVSELTRLVCTPPDSPPRPLRFPPV